MKDRNEAKDEMSERLGQRFSGEETDEEDNSVESDKSGKQNKSIKQDKEIMEAKSDKPPEDYKDAWGSKLIHLPDELLDPVDNEFKRLSYECDWDVKKERHYYPVVVARGVEAVQEMSAAEFTDAVGSLELR